MATTTEMENIADHFDLDFANPIVVPPWDLSDRLQNITLFNVSSCNVVISADLLIPPPFQATNRLKRTNKIALRFGGSRNMITLLEGTSQEKEQYLVGLVSSSVVMAVFYVLWAILLLLFKYFPRKFTGFLCGTFVRPSRPSEHLDSVVDDADFEEHEQNQMNGDDQDGKSENVSLEERPKDDKVDVGDKQSNSDLEVDVNGELLPESLRENQGEKLGNHVPHSSLMKSERSLRLDKAKGYQTDAWAEWDIACQQQTLRRRRVGYAVLFSCVCIIASAIMFCVNGDTYIKRSLETVKEGLVFVQDLCYAGVDVIDSYIAREKESRVVIDDWLGEASSICPKVTEPVCNKTGVPLEECCLENIPFVNDTLTEIHDTLYEAQQYIFTEALKLRRDMQGLADVLDPYINGNNRLEFLFWISFGFTLLLAIMCALIIAAIVQLEYLGQHPRHWQELAREHVLVPLFSGFTFLAYVFAVAFVLCAVAASDWCIDSPDPKMTWLLDKSRKNIGDLMYNYANYYINRCAPRLLPTLLGDHTEDLLKIIGLTDDLFEGFQNIEAPQWENVCGTNFTAVQNLAAPLQDAFCVQIVTLQDLNRFLWCRNWNPAYDIFMYRAICEDAQSGLAWIAWTMYVIVVFSFIVLMLRAAMFDIQDSHEFRSTFQRNVDGCRYVFTCGYGCQCCRSKQKNAKILEDSELELKEDKEQNSVHHQQQEEDEVALS